MVNVTSGSVGFGPTGVSARCGERSPWNIIAGFRSLSTMPYDIINSPEMILIPDRGLLQFPC